MDDAACRLLPPFWGARATVLRFPSTSPTSGGESLLLGFPSPLLAILLVVVESVWLMLHAGFCLPFGGQVLRVLRFPSTSPTSGGESLLLGPSLPPLAILPVVVESVWLTRHAGFCLTFGGHVLRSCCSHLHLLLRVVRACLWISLPFRLKGYLLSPGMCQNDIYFTGL